MRAAALPLLALIACDKPQPTSQGPTTATPTPSAAPSATATATATATTTAAASVTTTATATATAPISAPKGAAVSATGKRTERAAKNIALCKSPPPVNCASNADCTTFDIATWDGPCSSTLKAGINAAQKADYVSRNPCEIAGPAHPPPCVVHWVRAEDGPENPPPRTTIAATCVRGTCISQYFAATE